MVTNPSTQCFLILRGINLHFVSEWMPPCKEMNWVDCAKGLMMHQICFAMVEREQRLMISNFISWSDPLKVDDIKRSPRPANKIFPKLS
jgi:hypothetical protein